MRVLLSTYDSRGLLPATAGARSVAATPLLDAVSRERAPAAAGMMP
jgi:hypothetical protein